MLIESPSNFRLLVVLSFERVLLVLVVVVVVGEEGKYSCRLPVLSMCYVYIYFLLKYLVQTIITCLPT